MEQPKVTPSKPELAKPDLVKPDSVRGVAGKPPGPSGEGEASASGEYDALADLFLAGDSGTPGLKLVGAETHARPGVTTLSVPSVVASGGASPGVTPTPATIVESKPSRLRIEGLILGHLPVLAAAWVGQYARQIASQRQETVALVRVQSGQLFLDLIGSGVAARREEFERASAGAWSLEDAARFAARSATTWLVRVEEPSEPELIDSGVVGEVTVLTGADDAALVASYRAMKFLANRENEANALSDGEAGGDAFGEGLGEVGGEARPGSYTLRVVVMGSTTEKAGEASVKLKKTARAFLGREIEVQAGSARLAPAPTLTVFRGDSPAVSRIGEVIRGASAELRIEGGVSVPVPAASVGHAGGKSGAKRGVPELVAAAFGGPAGVGLGVSLGAGSAAGSAPVAKSAPVGPGDLELAKHLPGLVGLKARCPFAPKVQLAADASGALHLLAYVADSRELADEAVGQTVAKLVSVAGWAFDHLELLRLASPGVTLSGESEKTALHLLTDQPRNVRRLLDSGVQLHLLAAVNVGGETAWVCRELN